VNHFIGELKTPSSLDAFKSVNRYTKKAFSPIAIQISEDITIGSFPSILIPLKT